MSLVDKHNQRDHNTARLALIIYALLVGGCITASFYLLKLGKDVTGSIFGGAAVILALAVLITRRQPKNPKTVEGRT